MTQLKVYGTSDDLIEVEMPNGYLTGSNEFDAVGGPNYVAFSDGTVVHIRFDGEGVWRVSVVRKGTATSEHSPPGWDDEDGWTECVTLTGEFSWIQHCGGDEDAATALAKAGDAVQTAFDVFGVLDDHADFDAWFRELDAETATAILVDLAEKLTPAAPVA